MITLGQMNRPRCPSHQRSDSAGQLVTAICRLLAGRPGSRPVTGRSVNVQGRNGRGSTRHEGQLCSGCTKKIRRSEERRRLCVSSIMRIEHSSSCGQRTAGVATSSARSGKG